MFAEHRVVNLFPTPVWAHVLGAEDIAAVNRKALDAVETIKAETRGADKDEVWQTEATLQRLPEFLVLSGFIKEAAQNVLGHLQLEAGAPKVAALWATVVPKGVEAAAAPQTGPEGSLCGLYSVAAPEGGGTVTFLDGRPEIGLPGARVVQPNPYNARNAGVTVTPGTLLVFPSWLGCAANSGGAEQDRVSLGFHVTFGD